MKKLILLILTVSAFALQFDVNALINLVKKHPEDLKNRLVIASYFIEHKNYAKAEKYINYVLKKDPHNKYALNLKNKISAIIVYQKYISKYKTPINAIDNLYKNNKYKQLLEFYKAYEKLNTTLLPDKELLDIARVALWEGKYDLSLNTLDKLKNKQTLDYYDIKANDLYYLGDYSKAQKYFSILYESTGKKEYAQKLLNIYFYLGEYQKAKKLLLNLKRTDPKLALKFEKKLQKLQNQTLQKLKNNYLKNPTFENMKKYAFALYNINHQKAIDLVKNYIKNNPNDNQAKIFLAQLLSWSGNSKEALQYLSKFQNSNNYQAKLLFGKILAWQGEYQKAIPFLSDVYLHGNEKQKYEAQKTLAFIYMWEGNNKKAKKLFEKLIKKNPNDQDVKEALMVLNGNVKPLIKKYEKLLKKHPNNAQYILKLANYYYMLKDYKKAAYYYEKYLQLKPEKIEIYKTLGDIYLQLKDFYKGFGDWEYYANYKNTKEAYLELAQRYYWNGFNKEALNVLNQLLNKYPNYEKAVILKAKILKINPRFVNSNSAVTINKYFNTKAQKIQALGDRAYFAGLYKTAADYYKEYLFIHPDDYNVMERYAYALEYSNEPAKAAGEFYLLMWWKKNPIIEYHYAYNLQKAGKIKRAEKIYKQLLKQIPRPLPEFLKKFLNDWKKAWESMDFKKYEKYYGKDYQKDLYWKLRKQSIFKRSSFISVGIYDPILINQKDHTYTVKFFQVYASKIEKDKGYKTLVIKCDKNDKNCKIIKEEWKPGTYTPYNPENSLEKYIKQNLLQIEKQKYKLVPKKKLIKENTKKTFKLPPLKKDINSTNKIVLAPGEHKILQSAPEALNLTYMYKTQTTPKDVLSKTYSYSANLLYHWQLFDSFDYFVDNQKTQMWSNYFRISKHLTKDYYGFVFYNNYFLKQNGSNKNGYFYGAGINKKPFLFDLYLDKSGKNTIGWDFEYSPFLTQGLTLRINKKNLVYMKRSVCSAKHTRLKAEITGYKSITNYRELWWSLAFYHVDDGNNFFIPQGQYDFYTLFVKKLPLIFYFSTWFEFNSKTTDCYYSPKKTDTNIIGVRTVKKLTANLKGKINTGIGYSFFDKTYVYNLAAWLLYDNNNNINAKAGCQLSNSTPISKSSNYQSFECQISAGVLW